VVDAGLPQGTRSSKKRKQAKIKRVMATVKKAERKEAAGADGVSAQQGSFAAMHLLHDPQVAGSNVCCELYAILWGLGCGNVKGHHQLLWYHLIT
jgi:protein SDA1